MSPRFHSKRSDCDVILTGSVVCLWFSWKWWLIRSLIDWFPAESNSLMTFRWLRSCWRRLLRWPFSMLLKQSLAGVSSKPFHVDASFETSVFKIIRVDHELSLCSEIHRFVLTNNSHLSRSLLLTVSAAVQRYTSSIIWSIAASLTQKHG